MTPDEKEELREKWLAVQPGGQTLFDMNKCIHCNGLHDISPCPRVHRMSFTLVEGRPVLTEIEFWPFDQWPHDDVTFETDLYDE